MSTQPASRIEVNALSKRFGRRRLFRRLSFTLDGGVSLAVTGSNGSGKSTLLRILAGVLSPTSGTIALTHRGELISAEKRPINSALVAPYLNVYDGLTARENLEFIARVRRYVDAADRVDAALDQVGLSKRGDDLVQTYSSGMKQRVKFAAALLADPVLLLLDEPSSNLDEAGRAMVDIMMTHQQNVGGLLIVATNDASEAAVCDDRVCIEDFM
jgi:heme exporter protein A